MEVLAIGFVSWRGTVEHALVEIGSRERPDFDPEMVRRTDVAVSRFVTVCGITDQQTQETAVVNWGTTELDPELDCKRCIKKVDAVEKAAVITERQGL